MNDLILNSYVENFSNSYGHSALNEATQFEYFVNYCVLARDFQGSFDLDDISTGTAMGIDGLAILVNDALCQSPTEISTIAKSRLDAHFLFTQAKTSTSIDLGEFLKFLVAVEGFFTQTNSSEESLIADRVALKDEIYKNAIKFDENPTLTLVFCYPGLWQGNALIEQQIEAFTSRIKASALFSHVEVQIFDGEQLKSIYRALSNKITRQISFEKHTILPKIPGVKRAFIGILPCNEYLKLICDEDGKISRNVFYDNVRDYQGENSVNREIIETLKADDEGGQIFVLLNNGVTIVAKSINPVGTDFTVRDFQVVNGCQTSHVLVNNRNILTGNEFISVKLIETDNVDLTNKITKATNRQTEIKLEAFAGLQQFHKELEAFYGSIPAPQRLYYERRSGQFDGDNSVARNRIISIPNQIKSFVSVFLEEPHQIHFYYGKLLEDYSSGDNSVLFNEAHDTYPYYLGSWLVFLLGETLKSPQKVSLRPWRYHLALMLKILVAGAFSKERLADAKFCKAYCDRMLKVLSERRTFQDLEKQAEQLLLAGISETKRSQRSLMQDEKFTQSLAVKCTKAFQASKMDKTPHQDAKKFDGFYVGKIKVVAPEQKLGFIAYGKRQFAFNTRDAKLPLSMDQPIRFRMRGIGDQVEAYDLAPLETS